MRACWLLCVVGGCSLYFKEPPSHDPPLGELVDAVIAPDASTCPKPGTYAEILYPLDGATDVVQPVPSHMHVVIPNTLDGKGIDLTDANGQSVPLSHWDGDCSVGIPNQTGPTQDETWTECYTGLAPNALYTWHIWLTCYDASGIHELATSTFRTAP